MSRSDPQRDILAYATGHYRFSQSAALVATQAASPAAIFSCRWTDATRLMVLERVRLKWVQTTAWTATQVDAVSLGIARSYTVTDTGGVSVIANIVKQRTSMAASLMGDIRVANTAAGITAGTRTLDSGDFDALFTVNTITNVNTILYDTGWDANQEKHPVVLAQNEGLVARLSSALPAAGTATFYIELDWAEVNGYGP